MTTSVLWRTVLIILCVGSAAGAALADPAGDPAAGKKAFNMQCRVCHQVESSAGNGVGPNLAGVIGRPPGGLPGFDYSPALKGYGAKGAKWDVAALTRFLANPQLAVPGTRMPISMPNAATRQDLIAYLQTLRR